MSENSGRYVERNTAAKKLCKYIYDTFEGVDKEKTMMRHQAHSYVFEVCVHGVQWDFVFLNAWYGLHTINVYASRWHDVQTHAAPTWEKAVESVIACLPIWFEDGRTPASEMELPAGSSAKPYTGGSLVFEAPTVGKFKLTDIVSCTLTNPSRDSGYSIQVNGKTMSPGVPVKVKAGDKITAVGVQRGVIGATVSVGKKKPEHYDGETTITGVLDDTLDVRKVSDVFTDVPFGQQPIVGKDFGLTYLEAMCQIEKAATQESPRPVYTKPNWFTAFERMQSEHVADLSAYRQLIAILLPHAGEAGQNEGAVETLSRVIMERHRLGLKEKSFHSFLDAVAPLVRPTESPDECIRRLVREQEEAKAKRELDFRCGCYQCWVSSCGVVLTDQACAALDVINHILYSEHLPFPDLCERIESIPWHFVLHFSGDTVLIEYHNNGLSVTTRAPDGCYDSCQLPSSGWTGDLAGILKQHLQKVQHSESLCTETEPANVFGFRPEPLPCKPQ